MTASKIGEDKFLIILRKKDANDFSLSFDSLNFEDKHSRRVLLRLLRDAGAKLGISLSGKSTLLEAVEFENEIYILATVKSRRAKRYRLKECAGICYLLGSSENFLNAVEQLYRQNVCCRKNSAYVCGGRYYLIFDYPSIPLKLRRVLSEFEAQRTNGVHAARVRETGKDVCGGSAIECIGRHLV